jgi:ankyrin repeat protein
MFYAAFCGFSGLFKHLIAKHPGCISGKWYTPLHEACRSGDLECMRLLLEHGADVDARDVDHYTPSHLASRLGRMEALRLLLQYNSDVNAKGRSDLTALHIASRIGLTEVAQVLLEHGANVNAQTRHILWTPLWGAALNRRHDVVQLLLDHGADVRMWRKYGPLYTLVPLYIAAEVSDCTG